MDANDRRLSQIENGMQNVGRWADRVKLICWDGTGVCLYAKRLEAGAFRWPNVQDGAIHLTAAQLSALLEGLDWRRVHTTRETTVPTQPS
jgi:transposase